MKKHLMVLFLLALGSLQPVYAKLYIPETDEQFYREVSRHDMAVVHFNPYPINEDDEPMLDRMKDAFVSLANADRFKDADVAFIGVNLQTIPELADDFDIEVPDFPDLDDDEDEDFDEMDDDMDDDLDEKDTQQQEKKKIAEDKGDKKEDEDEIQPEEQSTVILFKRGEALKQDGKMVKRTGFLTKIKLEDFIENNFGGAIDQILARKKQQERLRLQARQARPARQVKTRRVYSYAADDQYYAPRRSYTYARRPYYGYWRRPYWRRGYYGGYPYGYGPGFGVGFGFGGRRGGFGFGFGW